MEEFCSFRTYSYKMLQIYHVSFKNLSDLNMYLMSNPTVNHDVFLKQHSIVGDMNFAGESLSAAINYCLGGYEENFDMLLKLNHDLEKLAHFNAEICETIKSFAGSRPNVPAFIAGSPKAMFQLKRTNSKQFITVYFNLACPVKTNSNAILDRGVLTLNLVKLLENQGFRVNLKVFMTVYNENEVFYFEIMLKKPDEQLNIRKCYYPMCSREFVRRIIFRVMESVPFLKKSWYPNYGVSLTGEQIRSIFEIDNNDIVVSTPDEIGITGESIYSDAQRFFKIINSDNSINVQYCKETAEDNDGKRDFKI